MASVLWNAPSHLLLLPKAPSSGDARVLHALYNYSITYTLQQIQTKCSELKRGASLDIAVSFPYLRKHRDAPRSALYPVCQALVAGIYKLVCVTAAKNGINVEDSEGIDVRVLLVAEEEHESDGDLDHSLGAIGPALSLSTLARSSRKWEAVFTVNSEEGNQVLKEFQIWRNHQLNVYKIPSLEGGKDGAVAELDDQTSPTADRPQHLSIAVGGTWDHIHIGHKLLLTMLAFLLKPLRNDDNEQRSLTVGVTGDELLKEKKYAEVLENWDARQSSAATFLRAVMDFREASEDAVNSKELANPGPHGRIVHFSIGPRVLLKLVEIQDGYGPTITDESISALILSAETRAGGKAVNDKRAEKGWPSLELFEVDVLDAEQQMEGSKVDDSFQTKLSSTGIRKLLHEKRQKSHI